jgi:glutaredoxin
MDIRVYLYDDYDLYAVKILKLLEKCDLEFTVNTYSRGNMDYVSQEIGEKVRKLPQIIIDGIRIGGYYDLMELLINKQLIDYKGDLCQT